MTVGGRTDTSLESGNGSMLKVGSFLYFSNGWRSRSSLFLAVWLYLPSSKGVILTPVWFIKTSGTCVGSLKGGSSSGVSSMLSKFVGVLT